MNVCYPVNHASFMTKSSSFIGHMHPVNTEVTQNINVMDIKIKIQFTQINRENHDKIETKVQIVEKQNQENF